MKLARQTLRVLVSLSLRVDWPRTLAVVVIRLLGALALPLSALALRELINAAAAGNARRATFAAIAVALLWIADLTFAALSWYFQFDLAEKQSIAFDEDLIALGSETAGLGHLEDPAWADQLATFREDGRELWWAFYHLVSIAIFTVQVALTVALLGLVSPVLLAIPVFALPSLLAGRHAQSQLEQAKQQTAAQSRLARHLLELATQAPAAKEIRIFGLQQELRQRQRDLYEATTIRIRHASRTGTIGRIAGQLIFSLAYVGALVVVIRGAVAGSHTVGDVILTATLMAQLNLQLARLLTTVNDVQSISRTIDRYLWLRQRAPTPDPKPPRAHPPTRIEDALELSNLSFRYPSASEPALSKLNLRIPPGTTLAIVGENGAGKTTLVKLLCGFYAPTSGSITVDGTNLSDYDPTEWRTRIAALYQDHAQLELVAHEAVGVGDLPRLTDTTAVQTAINRADANTVVASLPNGLRTQLGRSHGHGTELSTGQWQRVALARARMRDQPLLLLLDEPTSALDAQSEQRLLRRYARTAVAGRTAGGITILISHRFSGINIADIIIVLEHGEIIERGTHTQLLARRGRYAELHTLHTAAYR